MDPDIVRKRPDICINKVTDLIESCESYSNQTTDHVLKTFYCTCYIKSQDNHTLKKRVF